MSHCPTPPVAVERGIVLPTHSVVAGEKMCYPRYWQLAAGAQEAGFPRNWVVERELVYPTRLVVVGAFVRPTRSVAVERGIALPTRSVAAEQQGIALPTLPAAVEQGIALPTHPVAEVAPRHCLPYRPFLADSRHPVPLVAVLVAPVAPVVLADVANRPRHQLYLQRYPSFSHYYGK